MHHRKCHRSELWATVRVALVLVLAAVSCACDVSCPRGTHAVGEQCTSDLGTDSEATQSIDEPSLTSEAGAAGDSSAFGQAGVGGASGVSGSGAGDAGVRPDGGAAGSGARSSRAAGGAGAVAMTSAVPGACTPGDTRCAGDQRQERCDSSSTWMTVQVCPYACESGQCSGECRPGEKRCSGDGRLTPESCDAKGQWVAGAPCQNLCSNGSCAGSCSPGALQCGVDQTPEKCSPEGTWETQPSCDFVCSGAGECAGECKPGERRCGGGDMLTPLVCDDAGAWGALAPCPNVCSAGSCSGSCKPGERRCNASGISEECNASGAWIAEMPCPFVCIGAGECVGECKPGERSCSGDIPRVCDRAGKWQNQAKCPFVCSGAGVCSGECAPGAVGCAGQTPRRCDDGGTWRAGSACTESACNANTGACSGSCTPGSAQCAANGTRQVCSGAGAWTDDRKCAFVCTGAGNCTGVCKPGEKVCNGAAVRTCKADASGYDQVACAPKNAGETATCSAGVCGSVCDANPGRCPGSNKCWVLQHGCEECIEPYVWRDIRPGDRVCVERSVQTLVQEENQAAASRVATDPALIMMYGADACAEPYVWREAFEGDHVCVTRESRTRAANENASHRSRTRVGAAP